MKGAQQIRANCQQAWVTSSKNTFALLLPGYVLLDINRIVIFPVRESELPCLLVRPQLRPGGQRYLLNLGEIFLPNDSLYHHC
jgi:hypothetical protein